MQFTAPDLSSIAQQLDDEELQYNPERGSTSQNMDDTGFFSVQVVTRALDAFGLTCVLAFAFITQC
jgi:ataxin-3